MVTFKPAWLWEQELPTQVLHFGTQLLTLPSSSNDLIGWLDKVGGLLSQVYQNPSKSIQDALVPIKGIMILEVLIDQADFDVQISLPLCLSELIRITTPNLPFEDELMKKVFRVIVSSFEALLDSDGKSYHETRCILESCPKLSLMWGC